MKNAPKFKGFMYENHQDKEEKLALSFGIVFFPFLFSRTQRESNSSDLERSLTGATFLTLTTMYL